MLDTLASGTGVKVYANYTDGWSKIEYNGKTGYCKTEFLANAEGAPSEDASENTQEEQTTAAEATAVNKQMQFKEAVRIRADRSADSEKLANAYAKELVKVLENYSDGWSKVEYNGTTGYCRTEYLEEAQ